MNESACVGEGDGISECEGFLLFFFFFLAEWAAWRECEKVAGEGDK